VWTTEQELIFLVTVNKSNVPKTASDITQDSLQTWLCLENSEQLSRLNKTKSTGSRRCCLCYCCDFRILCTGSFWVFYWCVLLYNMIDFWFAHWARMSRALYNNTDRIVHQNGIPLADADQLPLSRL